MKKVKFPRTRRDKFIEHQKQLKEEREWWEKYMQQRQTVSIDQIIILHRFCGAIMKYNSDIDSVSLRL